MKSSEIGGQAVIEGVMMKNKDQYAVAVRKPDGEITVDIQKIEKKRTGILKAPIIRGVVAFVDSMVIGIKTLAFSASFFEEDEKAESKKGETADGEAVSETDTKNARPLEGKKNTGKKSAGDTALVFGTVAVSILFSVLIFMLLPMFLSRFLAKVIESQFLLTLIEGGLRILIFVGYVVAISQLNDIKRVFAYHGAEHKSINCIENGLELTVENVRGQNRQHKRCGTSFLLFVVFISLIFFLFIRVEQVWLQALIRVLLVPVIAGISYEIIRFAGKSENKVVMAISKPGFALQKLTTREPDDDMIEVAIASVEAVFDWRSFVEAGNASASMEAPKAETPKTEEAFEKASVPKVGKSAGKKIGKAAKTDGKPQTKRAETKTENVKKEAVKTEASFEEVTMGAVASTATAEATTEKTSAEEATASEATTAPEVAATKPATEEPEAPVVSVKKEATRDVDLSSLDKVLTVSKDDKPLVFKDPYEERKTHVVPVQEEDDEILSALDRYFVMNDDDEA